MVGEGVARRVVGLLLLLLMTSGVLNVLLCKYAEDTSGDLVMNDCLVVLADDVNTKFDYVLRLELKRFRFEALRAEPLAVDECAVGALHVFDENLSRFFPNFCMLTTEDL